MPGKLKATNVRVQALSISQIKLNQRNSRNHSAKQIRQIANSIVAFSFTNPLLVTEDGTLIAGEGRYKAAQLLGLARVPVIVLAGLSPARRRALAIADNEIAENAGWDRERLAIEIPELAGLLETEGLDVSILGFEAVEIDQLLIDFEEHAADPEDSIDSKWWKDRAVSWSSKLIRGLGSETVAGFRSRRGFGHDRFPVVPQDAPFPSYKTARVHRGSQRRDCVAAGGARAAAGDAGDRVSARRIGCSLRGACGAFRKGLSEAGYVEGQNVMVEYR